MGNVRGIAAVEHVYVPACAVRLYGGGPSSGVLGVELSRKSQMALLTLDMASSFRGESVTLTILQRRAGRGSFDNRCRRSKRENHAPAR